MIKKEELKLFGSQYNCSQAVMAVFCEELGLGKEMALKLTKGFGGGASRGELCGAVSAGIMILGLKYGDKAKPYVGKFENRIEEIYGSIRCEKMLGYSLSNKEDSKVIENKKLKSEICPNIVKDSVLIIESIINGECY